MKKITVLLISLSVFGGLMNPLHFVSAAEKQSALDLVKDGLSETGTLAGYETEETTSLPSMVGAIIGVLLSMIGVVLVVILVYGGFQYLTAGGNEDQVKKAKTMMIRALIGMVIILAAYAIAAYVTDIFILATEQQTS